MTLRLLLDMNLSVAWVPMLIDAGYETVHWRDLGQPDAPDTEIMAWARNNGRVVLTHDLDFGMLLALTQSTGPSVVQLRGMSVVADLGFAAVHRALGEFANDLGSGALIVVDPERKRIRRLPIR